MSQNQFSRVQEVCHDPACTCMQKHEKLYLPKGISWNGRPIQTGSIPYDRSVLSMEPSGEVIRSYDGGELDLPHANASYLQTPFTNPQAATAHRIMEPLDNYIAETTVDPKVMMRSPSLPYEDVFNAVASLP